MKTVQTRTIDGCEWTVTQFPTTIGLDMAARLLRLISSPVGEAISGIEGNLLDAKISVGSKVLGKALQAVRTSLDPKEMVDLAVELLADTRCDKREINRQTFDVVFQGKYLTLLKVLGFVLEVNFQLPLTGWLLSLASQRDEEEKPSSIREAS